MHPEICKIGSFTIYSYGLMLVAAFFVSSYLVRFQAKKEGFDPEKIFNLLFYVFLSGIAGSRLFYVFYNFSFYLNNPLEIIMLQRGGMAWFGGLIFGTATAIIIIKKYKIGLLKTLDLLIPFVALGQSIGRIGCLLNGCCFGKTSVFGIYFENLDQVLIPTQLYSSLLLLSIFIILRFMQDRKHLPGQILSSYLLLYSIKRFVIEFFRDDSPKEFYGLTIFQLLSLAVFIISLVIFKRIFRSRDKR
jgi:phosphatidylglycerol:prolipoprotein diacylglycerol transferase